MSDQNDRPQPDRSDADSSTVHDEQNVAQPLAEHLIPDQIASPSDPAPATAPNETPSDPSEEAVTSPAKVMRIGSMVRQLLEEVRQAPLDEASRERLAEVYERSVTELADALSDDLQDELRNLALPFGSDTPSESELRVAKAQLVGWLEGLFHGIQATLFAQQLAARQQFEQMRQLPPGAGQMGQPSNQAGGGGDPSVTPGGVYL